MRGGQGSRPVPDQGTDPNGEAEAPAAGASEPTRNPPGPGKAVFLTQSRPCRKARFHGLERARSGREENRLRRIARAGERRWSVIQGKPGNAKGLTAIAIR
ncbi:hypothetical protein FRZ61_11170 [Hypericibacter adhaerens]|uniref:Uncharacterized protein n=1 Tax=Hypericibacter adhaerens TaxID=2602016 RepID=A0A5J6MWW4_9PROT|nr:hypothetical protein FRZ61_11170 [Hypericibacter adhaerens]